MVEMVVNGGTATSVRWWPSADVTRSYSERWQVARINCPLAARRAPATFDRIVLLQELENEKLDFGLALECQT